MPETQTEPIYRIVEDLHDEPFGPFGIVDTRTGKVVAVYRSRRGAVAERDRMVARESR